MKIRAKIPAILTAIALIMPATALAYVSIDGTQYSTEEQTETWHYDGAETLTLNGHQSTGSIGSDQDKLNIILNGDNRVSRVALNGDLSIKGGDEGGSLTVDGDGIETRGSLSIEDASITVYDRHEGDNSSIFAADISITNSTVTTTNETYGSGIGTRFQSGGDITIEGSTINATGGYHAISGNTVTIIDSDVEAATVHDGPAIWASDELVLDEGYQETVVDSEGWLSNFFYYYPDGHAVEDSDGSLTSVSLKAPLYTLSYDPAGGTLNGQSGVVEDGGHRRNAQVAIADAPVREGYTFLYWQGSEYRPGETYTVDGDHTFTAVWEKDPEPEPAPEPEPEPTPEPAPEREPASDESPLPPAATPRSSVLPNTADAALLVEGSVAASGALLALAGFLRRRRDA